MKNNINNIGDSSKFNDVENVDNVDSVDTLDNIDSVDDIYSQIFTKSEYDNLKPILTLISKEHDKHINDRYVYGCADDWIIIYEKTPTTKTNEDRSNISNHLFAEYEANELSIILIFNKFCPHDTISNLTSQNEICSIVNYNKGQIIRNNNFRLVYYKSILIPYFKNLLNRAKSNYTGFFVSWHENGLISEKGYYVDGEKNGLWEYKTSSLVSKIKYKNGMVQHIYDSVNLVDSTKLTKSTKSTESTELIKNSNNDYLNLILKNLNYVFEYVKYFFPFTSSN